LRGATLSAPPRARGVSHLLGATWDRCGSLLKGLRLAACDFPCFLWESAARHVKAPGHQGGAAPVGSFLGLSSPHAILWAILEAAATLKLPHRLWPTHGFPCALKLFKLPDGGVLGNRAWWAEAKFWLAALFRAAHGLERAGTTAWRGASLSL